jgi:hypothetical protein
VKFASDAPGQKNAGEPTCFWWHDLFPRKAHTRRLLRYLMFSYHDRVNMDGGCSELLSESESLPEGDPGVGDCTSASFQHQRS